MTYVPASDVKCLLLGNVNELVWGKKKSEEFVTKGNEFGEGEDGMQGLEAFCCMIAISGDSVHNWRFV